MAHSTLNPIRWPNTVRFLLVSFLLALSRGIFTQGIGIRFSECGNPRIFGPPRSLYSSDRSIIKSGRAGGHFGKRNLQLKLVFPTMAASISSADETGNSSIRTNVDLTGN